MDSVAAPRIREWHSNIHVKYQDWVGGANFGALPREGIYDMISRGIRLRLGGVPLKINASSTSCRFAFVALTHWPPS